MPEGIEFTLTDESGNVSGTGETDRFGEVSFIDLTEGNYYLTEEILEGYTNDIKNEISLRSANVGEEPLRVIVTNTKDSDPGMYTIEVKKEFKGLDHLIQVLVEFTLSDGNDFKETKGLYPYVFENVPEGEYLLTEKPLGGFTSSIQGGMEISLPEDADNQNYMEIVVTNTKIPDDDDTPPTENLPEGKMIDRQPGYITLNEPQNLGIHHEL